MSLMLFVAALAGQTAAAAPAASPASPAPAARVCRKMPPPTGSRMAPKRVCRSSAEWAAIDAESEQDIDAMRRRTGRQNY